MELDGEVLERLGAAIGEIGTPGFAPRLAAALRAVVPYSYTVVFGYRGEARPLDLFDDFPADKRHVFVTDYQAGPYLLDPFFLAANRPVAAGLYRMRDLAPDRFYQGEYFRTYYVRTGLAEEIGYFADTGAGSMVVVSLMRADVPFSAREFRQLSALRPVVLAAVRRTWTGFAETAAAAAAPGDGRLERSLAAFGAGLLTAREREVAELTLKGHSAEAAGRILGIAEGTVRIHRRNIYAKLGIASQGELFSRFMATLARAPVPGPASGRR